MKYKTYKKSKGIYPVYTLYKDTAEIEIKLYDTTINIYEQQYNRPIDEPMVDITVGDRSFKLTYREFMSCFIRGYNESK